MKRALMGVWLLFAGTGTAAEPAKAKMTSEVLGRDVNFSILLPDSYKTDVTKRFPVIYVLDGWGGNGMGLFYNNAIKQKPFIQNFADEKQTIVVNFGNPSDWYFDAPLDPKLKYGTFLSTEFVDHVDKTYRTIATREGRAVAGFSSGGHGALWLAFQNPKRFIAAGSVFGCPDLTRYVGSKPDWKLPHVLGPHKDNAENWIKCSLESHLQNVKGAGLTIWFGCGVKDELLPDNRKLSDRMKALDIEHVYYEAAGGHDGQFAAPAFQECMSVLEKSLKHQ